MKDILVHRQELRPVRDGRMEWTPVSETLSLEPERSAIIIVDMWDRHWCTGANLRGAPLADRIDRAVRRARSEGFLIVHAPSDVASYYAGTPARERFLAEADATPAPIVRDIAPPPSPLDASDGGSDTPRADAFPPNTIVWTRQTERIAIDQERDLICDDEGDALFGCLSRRGIRSLIYMGVHTNMCVVGRSFGIIAMLRRGMSALLARDLTDTMYNPARSPYVAHDEGTRLYTGYVEKFLCPTLDAGEAFRG